MLLADTLTNLSATGSVLATILGAAAVVLARRNDTKGIALQEERQAFELQAEAMTLQSQQMDRVLAESDRVRARNEQMHESLNTALAKVAEITVKHERCERDLNALGNRLRIAEARITELGG